MIIFSAKLECHSIGQLDLIYYITMWFHQKSKKQSKKRHQTSTNNNQIEGLRLGVIIKLKEEDDDKVKETIHAFLDGTDESF